MKKMACIVFVAALLASSLTVVATFGTVHASSNVSGILTSDSTWTKANSPYSLTNNVLIDAGVTVTVESEATVNLNGYYIRVNGSLIIQPGTLLNMGTTDTHVGFIEVNGVLTARGTNASPIQFNGAVYYWDSLTAPPTISRVYFADSSLSWNEQTSSGCIVENAVMDNTSISMSSSVKVCDNKMNGAGIGITKGSPIISNNDLSNGAGISILGGSPSVANNQLNGGRIYLDDDDNGIDSPIISSNVISDPKILYNSHPTAIVVGSLGNNKGLVLIEKNIITNSFCGIQLAENENQNVEKPITIQNNTITHNQIGIVITGRFSPTIINNNIYDNSANIKLSLFASRDINATNNWWGTTDLSTIDILITDFNDDFDLGKVNYTPFLSAANPQAEPDTNALTPTPSPTSTATQSASPSPSPTPTATQSASPSQSLSPTNSQTPPSSQNPTGQSQPSTESGSLGVLNVVVAVLAVTTAALLIVVAVLLRKNRKHV